MIFILSIVVIETFASTLNHTVWDSRILEDSESGGKGDVAVPFWSVALPIISLSLFSWLAKFGTRCCAVENVADDVVSRDYCVTSGLTDDDCRKVEKHNGGSVTDIEMHEVKGENLSEKHRRQDPVVDSSLLDQSSCVYEDEADSQFSWRWNGTLSTVLYQTMK